jgi:hypothetical protein
MNSALLDQTHTFNQIGHRITELQSVALRLSEADLDEKHILFSAEDAVYRLEIRKPAAIFISRWPNTKSEISSERVEPHQVPPDVIDGWNQVLTKAVESRAVGS